MDSLIILLVAWISLVVLGYFLLLALFNLLKNIFEQGEKTLKGIFVLVALIGAIFLATNKSKSNEYIQNIKDWKTGLIQPEQASVYDF